MRKHTISKVLAVTLATSLVTYSLPVNSQASMFPVTDNILNIRSDDLNVNLLQNIVNYDILKTLEEYWFDDEGTFEKWKNRLQSLFSNDLVGVNND